MVVFISFLADEGFCSIKKMTSKIDDALGGNSHSELDHEDWANPS